MRESIDEIFSKVDDPRVTNRCLHLLKDVLFIAFCTLLSNGEDFEDMVEFGKQRYDWLKTVLDLPNGIPSHDTFNRVLQLIDPEQLQSCLADDGGRLLASVQGELISFDGKKIKGESPHSRGNNGLFILSAWVGSHRLCIGQKKVEDKSNEIKAIPDLLDSLDVAGSIISIDAIGCQSEIAEKIIDSEADYLLAVKKNQRSLYQAMNDDWIWQQAKSFDESWEYDHGRYEKRRCEIISASLYLSPKLLEKWEGVKTLVRVISERTKNGTTSTETRYYISSESKDAAYYNAAVRGHWGIENQLHWHLDVTFKEDACRSRSGNAPQNLNILRKMALHRISRMKDKLSLKKRRFRASMNMDYLTKIVAG